MDELDSYREIIQRALQEYAAIPYAYGDIESHIVLDRAGDQYLLVNVGWDNGRRVHGCLIHIDIINGKSGFNVMERKRGLPVPWFRPVFQRNRLF